MLLVTGCHQQGRFLAVDVDPLGWQNAAIFPFGNSDTTALCDIGIFLRLNDRFTEDTLTVRIVTRTPDHLRHEEPLLLVLPPDRKPASLHHEATIPYRRRVRFAHSGNYRICIIPSRPVEGVEAAGIDIVQSH